MHCSPIMPTISISKDYHLACSTRRRLLVAGAISTSTAASSSGRAGRASSGSRARSRPGASATATYDNRGGAGRSDAVGSAPLVIRGVGIHDKDAGSARLDFFRSALRDEGNSLRVWGSIPHRAPRRGGRAFPLRSGFGDGTCASAIRKCFMDVHARPGPASMTDGSGVEITSRSELGGDHPAAERGWPAGVHAIGDQANRNASTHRRRRASAWVGGSVTGSSTHSARRPSCPASPSLDRLLGPVLARPGFDDLAGLGTGPIALAAPTPSGQCSRCRQAVANGSDAPVELDPPPGSPPVYPVDRRAASSAAEETLTLEQAPHATCVARRFPATNGALPGLAGPPPIQVLDRDPLAVDMRKRETLKVA